MSKKLRTILGIGTAGATIFTGCKMDRPNEWSDIKVQKVFHKAKTEQVQEAKARLPDPLGLHQVFGIEQGMSIMDINEDGYHDYVFGFPDGSEIFLGVGDGTYERVSSYGVDNAGTSDERKLMITQTGKKYEF